MTFTTEYTPATVDLYVTKGSDFQSTLTLRDGTEPIDLTGYEFTLSIAEYYHSKKQTFDVEVFSQPEAGLLTVTIPSEYTETMTKQRYVYSISAQSEDLKLIIAKGQMLVDPTP
jgi:hypothetical protein